MSYIDGAKSTTRPIKILFSIVGVALVASLAWFVLIPNWNKAHEPQPAPTKVAATIPPKPKPSPTPSPTPTKAAKAKVSKPKHTKK